MICPVGSLRHYSTAQYPDRWVALVGSFSANIKKKHLQIWWDLQKLLLILFILYVLGLMWYGHFIDLYTVLGSVRIHDMSRACIHITVHCNNPDHPTAARLTNRLYSAWATVTEDTCRRTDHRPPYVHRRTNTITQQIWTNLGHPQTTRHKEDILHSRGSPVCELTRPSPLSRRGGRETRRDDTYMRCSMRAASFAKRRC